MDSSNGNNLDDDTNDKDDTFKSKNIPITTLHTKDRHDSKVHSNSPITGSPWKINVSSDPLPSFSELLKLESNGMHEDSESHPLSHDIVYDEIDYSCSPNDDITQISGFYYDRTKSIINECSPYNSQCSTPLQSASSDSILTAQKSCIMVGPDDQSSSSLKKHYSGLSSILSETIHEYDQDSASSTKSPNWRPTPQWKQKRLKKISFVYSNFRLIISSNSAAIQKYSPDISSLLYQSTTPTFLDIDPKHSDLPLFFKYPDVFPLWSDIVAVVQYQTFSSKEREQHDMGRTIPTISWPCCSICLAEWIGSSSDHTSLVCPRLTPCGHTFCYPCLVHYFIENGVKWRPCPVCFEYLCLDELKPLIIHSLFKESTEQEFVEFSKMNQLHGTILTRSIESSNDSNSVHVPIISSFGLSYWLEKDPFNRYFIASPEWCLESIYKPELLQLVEMLHRSVQEEDWTMIPFYEISISNIEKWISNSLAQKDKVKQSSVVPLSTLQDLYTICIHEQDMEESKESEMFYQSPDGRFLFLAPSSIRKLEERTLTLPCRFSYEMTASESGEFEELVMTKERRKRYSKYFGHLPLGCRFILLYI